MWIYIYDLSSLHTQGLESFHKIYIHTCVLHAYIHIYVLIVNNVVKHNHCEFNNIRPQLWLLIGVRCLKAPQSADYILFILLCCVNSSSFLNFRCHWRHMQSWNRTTHTHAHTYLYVCVHEHNKNSSVCKLIECVYKILDIVKNTRKVLQSRASKHIRRQQRQFGTLAHFARVVQLVGDSGWRWRCATLALEHGVYRYYRAS